MNICVKCKYCYWFFGYCCKFPNKVLVSPVTGKPFDMDCADFNPEGKCKDYKAKEKADGKDTD